MSSDKFNKGNSDILNNIYKLLGKLNLLQQHQNENKYLIKKLERRLSQMEEMMSGNNQNSTQKYSLKFIHNLKIKLIILSSYVILDILLYLLSEKGVLQFITTIFS